MQNCLHRFMLLRAWQIGEDIFHRFNLTCGTEIGFIIVGIICVVVVVVVVVVVTKLMMILLFIIIIIIITK